MKSRSRKRSRPWSWYQTWEPTSKRERAELAEPIDADSRDTDLTGIAAELRLMVHEITRDLARNGHHLRVCE